MTDLAKTKKLISALENDDLEAVEKLLAASVDVNALDDKERTPLYVAASVDTMALLLARGADPNIACHGEMRLYPLGRAVYFGIPETRMLLDAGADPKVRSGDGKTLLHAIAESSRAHAVEVTELLLALGVATDVRDEEGKLAFDLTSNDRLQELLRVPGVKTRRERLAELDAGAAPAADDLDLLEERAAERHRTEEHEEAIADFRRVLAIEPDREFSLRLAAQSLEELGRLAEAVDMWDQLVAAASPDGDGLRLYRALFLNAKLARWAAVRADVDAIAKSNQRLDGEERRMLAVLRRRLALAEAGDLAGAAVEDHSYEDGDEED